MKIFWLLCGNQKVPSSRIHGINVHLQLVRLGYPSFLVHVPFFYTEDIIWNSLFVSFFIDSLVAGDIVIFQKLSGPKTLALVDGVKNVNAKTIFIDCDLPVKSSMAKCIDQIICPSQSLADYYINLGHKNVKIIFDAVEVFKKPVPLKFVSKKIIWFGKSGLGKWELISQIKNFVFPQIAPNWIVFTLSNHENSDYDWDVETFDQIISKHDLCIIPIDKSESNLVKSANRCTQSMALGVPVLTNFLESYSRIIVNFQNGLMSDDFNEWKDFLIKCEDPRFLNDLKMKAYEDSLNFSIEYIIKDWINLLGLCDKKKIKFRKIKDIFLYSFLYQKLACSRIFYER
ncbi:glycosyltransferase family 1 protein [Algoriphagus zhangzhouensis]|uniref:Glycosyl transferases group 1 n=1 Tax=Algoriphagus zhangzhouensis TaxID=1073327 RepID=A0A1M7ZKI6_9BACT|nr:glycosyltransferase family 1 protein [Algoriphagus zhangzhouensis]TDY42874.1 hypothetical protein A8938_4053 [Algoriphagus zhangzhouensis]SHO65387.1 hypothetical protein SAMN04488108_4048 [Algoriphagus zhangzhouensis]